MVHTFLTRKTSEPPKWMGKLETASPKVSFRLGFLLLRVFPTDLLTSVAVGAYLSSHGDPWWHLLPFVLLTLLFLALSALILLAFGKRGQAFLPKARDWMNANSWSWELPGSGVTTGGPMTAADMTLRLARVKPAVRELLVRDRALGRIGDQNTCGNADHAVEAQVAAREPVVRTPSQPALGWTVVLRRQPARIVEGRPEGGYTDAYELICCECGDHPDLDYRDVSPRLQRVRGPYLIAAGITAYQEHVKLCHGQPPAHQLSRPVHDADSGFSLRGERERRP